MTPSCLVLAPPGFDSEGLRAAFDAEDVAVEIALHPEMSHPSPAVKGVGTVFVLLPRLSPASAVEVVARLSSGKRSNIVACVAQATLDLTRALEQCGASDVVTPATWDPARVAERVIAVLIERDQVGPASLDDLRGGTLAMRKVYERIERLAPFNDPVLVRGETGTGKELVARALHARSGRREMLAVSVAELKPELLESELFGHERGAFSGAHVKRRGLFEAAEDGTLFLDEVGELPLSAQAKLLRVLEYREVRPVGANTTVPVRARIVMATHRDLEQEVARGAFRADFFYRVAGSTVVLPPLRDRLADVPLLSRHLLGEFDREHGGRHDFFPRAMDRLMAHRWPGNVRELRNVVRGGAMEAGRLGGAVRVDALREAPHPARADVIPFDPTTEPWKEVQLRGRAVYLEAVLAATGGNHERAMARSGLSKSQFYEWLKELRSSRS